MKPREVAVAAALGWALTFGNPQTEGVGWKTLDRFDSQAACEQERTERAREVRDKTTTSQSLAAVLRFYRCVQAP